VLINEPGDRRDSVKGIEALIGGHAQDGGVARDDVDEPSAATDRSFSAGAVGPPPAVATGRDEMALLTGLVRN
jgi:hypothetical protein